MKGVPGEVFILFFRCNFESYLISVSIVMYTI